MTFGAEEPQTDQLNLMTMDGARGVLNIAQALVFSKHEQYQITGLRTTLNIFNIFHERIMGLKNSNSLMARQIDLAKEERVQKANMITDIFRDIISNSRFLAAKSSPNMEL
jgi:hypothetical protein